MNKLKVVKEEQITDEVWVCPYCMNEVNEERGCCGESSAHFEKAYEVDGELYLTSELQIVKGASANGQSK